MRLFIWCIVLFICYNDVYSRDEDKIMKACYWAFEVYEPCFGGCAEVTCDNPRNHLRPCYPYCEPGCICEDPYVRDDRTHQCVLPQDCTPTQMGIPVPTKKTSKPSSAQQKYKPSYRKDEPGAPPADFPENEPIPNHPEDYKKGSESRTGNYFNIVIAPPPIKAPQSRKMVQENRDYLKRI